MPLLVLSEFFLIANNYLIVEFRLKLSYIKIFITNISSCIGYLTGYGILFVTGFQYWEIIFVAGYGMAFVYNLCSTSIWKQKLAMAPGFKSLLKDTNVLVATSAISGVSTYLDKLVIYPYLGAESMAYYQTASIISKVIPMLATSVSNVMLSYLVKIKGLSKKVLSICVAALFVLCAIGLLLCGMTVPVMIRFFYPDFYEGCIGLVFWANCIAMLQMFYTFISPVTLRYAERNMQYVIQIGRLAPYLLLTAWLVREHRLLGFCYATIISQIIQNMIMLIICFKAIGGRKNSEPVSGN